MNEPILKTQNLTKRYKKQIAVDHVNMTIDRGDIYGLVGQNGAGKTTLMRMVSALTFPDGGELQLFGQAGEELRKARKRMGIIIEMPVLYPSLTARQNLEYYRIQKGISDKGCVERSLLLSGLTDTGRKTFKNFSLGMKQRLGLALATMSNPDFLMLDEPINGLDPTGIVEIRETFKRLNSEGITILISSHILSELSMLVTKYGFIHKGRLIKELTHEQLQEQCELALHIQVDDSAKASAVLQTKCDIQVYKIISPTEIRVYDKSGIDKSPSIIKELVTGGVSVAAAYKIGDSLEDYYTNLVKGVQ